MKRHKCGFESFALKHPMKLYGFIDVAFKAQLDEFTGFAPRGVAATFREDSGGNDQPRSSSGKANLEEFSCKTTTSRGQIHF